MASCGLLNLASCIPEKLYDFIIGIINAPIQPLLNFVKDLMIEPVNIQAFAPIWAIMLYVLSTFYGLLLLYSGLNMMLSGHDAIRRAKSKEWFQNIFLMIIFTGASFYLYDLILDIASSLTAGMMSLVDANFFLLTANNIVNIGLEFFLGFVYVLTLILTALFLTIRYLIVASGVILFPIGIFLYFVPPLQDYGKLILNYLGVCLFVVFFDAVVFIVCSQLVTIPLFQNIKIMVMISAFSTTNLLMLYFMLFSIIKSAFKTASSVSKPIIAVAKYFV